MVVAVFAAAVAAALGAVGWLTFSRPRGTEPPTRPAATDGAKKSPPVSPKPDPGQNPRTKREPAKRHSPPTFEIVGEVRKPDGSAATGAKVSLLPPGVVATVPSLKGEPVPAAMRAVLRDLFNMDPDMLDACSPYAGVPMIAPPVRVPEIAAVNADGEGKFRIQVRSAGPFRVEARLEDVGRAVLDEVTAGGPPLILKLGAAAALRGRVLAAPARIPVAGATVVAQSGTVTSGATTDAEGAFTIPDLAPGRYSLRAGAPGAAPAALAGVEVSSTAPPVEVLLGEGFAVRVHVLREDRPPGARKKQGPPASGPAVEGATVVVYDRGQKQFASGTTDAEGAVRVARLGPGRWRVGVRKEGFLTAISQDVHFKPGGVAEESREVALQAEVLTPVKVLDASGLPLQGARLYTGGVEDEFDLRHSEEVGRTDQEGVLRFAFDPGIDRRSALFIVAEDGNVTRVEPDEPLAGTEVKVVLRPGRIVQGRIRDTAGKPVAGAQVAVTVTPTDDDWNEMRIVVYSDGEGAYRSPRVPFGELRIEVEKEDAFEEEDVDEEVRDDPIVKDFTLDLEPPPPKK